MKNDNHVQVLVQSVEDLRVDTVDGRARHVAKEVSGEELRQGRHVFSVQRVHEARDALLRELAQAQLSADVSLLRRMGQHLPDQLEQVGRPRHHCQPLRHGHLEREKGGGGSSKDSYYVIFELIVTVCRLHSVKDELFISWILTSG